ncbi:MAG: hypothetical protein AUJ96_06270 [Armatimonadetes bacterium CG2_30_66_41]|nr:hypothetical protein [Armatimonadota bacterium]NCO89989.1 hypothetical protein [Armatimonadota bacterium]NCP34256.1 hypothetical protein [Armatimonadota bacterium]NDK13957.1 hypothetical protein [Armatimonadota bacterium]OIP08248.1 MAG: hypothetical protein AUJ96_06270 [Armatimonadetes bacterium CG2_30_66_41]
MAPFTALTVGALALSVVLASTVAAEANMKGSEADHLPELLFEGNQISRLPRFEDAVADSLTGFGGTQGASGWQYGYMQRASAGAPGAFRHLERYEAGWWRRGNSPVPGVSATTFEASPGLAAVRRWTPREKGSVRVVGYLAKRSPQAEAEFRVLVEGKEIWKRQLARTDSIPHVFDLLALDLTEASAVDLLVVAGPNSPRVRVDVALQIVPEPFVSRWHAALPTGFPTFTEAEKEVLRKKGQDILQKIRDTFTLPSWFQARVTDSDRESRTLRAALMEGYEPRNANGEAETEGGRAFMFNDADGRFINHRHTPGKWQLSEDGASMSCQEMGRAGIPDALQTGDYVVGTIRTGAALQSVNCSGVRFEDVNLWSSPGIAVNEGGGEGGNVYLRVRATRRPRTNRLQAFGADIFHLAGTDRGPTLDRCELAYGADDNLNIHGSFGRIVQRVDDRHYYMQGAYEVGDTLEFRDMSSVALFGTAKAVSVVETPAGPSLAINDSYSAKGEFLVALDQPLELPAWALVVLDGKRSAGGFVLRNCWLHDNFQRTLSNGSPGGLIENATLQNVGQGLCIQFETWGPWMEGPFARDLVIRNSRFLDSPPDGAASAVSLHPPGGGQQREAVRSQARHQHDDHRQLLRSNRGRARLSSQRGRVEDPRQQHRLDASSHPCRTARLALPAGLRQHLDPGKPHAGSRRGRTGYG